MKKLLLTGSFCWLSFCISFAQQAASVNNFAGAIKGIIKDSLQQVVLSNVSVVLLDANRQFLRGIISKENGSFKFKGLPGKQYQLVFSCIGYQTKTIQLPPLTAALTDLHNISLVSSATELSAVQVVTQKQLIEQDADKIIYNVADDPDRQFLSVFEMLRKVPFLTVDADDNIQINNSSNYQVLLNGKRSSLFVNNPAEVFKVMRANTIKTIEVITSPPSRYDAEGSGGVINIVTWKRSIVGYTGSSTLALESPYAFNVSSFLMAGTGRFGFSGQAANNTQKGPVSSQHTFREQKALRNTFEQKGESEINNIIRYTTGDVSYDVSPTDLVSINYSVNNSSSDLELKQDGIFSDSNRVKTSSYRRINNTNNKSNGYDIGMNYQHSFKKNEQQLLTAYYKISNNSNGSTAGFNMQPLTVYDQVSKTNNNDNQQEHSFQVDYIQPVHQYTLEAGIKSIFLVSRSDYVYEHFDTAKSAYIEDTALGNRFTYRQQIQAAYSSVNIKKNAWQMKIGARLERTSINASFRSSAAVVSRQYLNFIPNVNLSRRLKGADLIRLSYTQRLERPGFYFLNPYVDVTNPGNISYGNPKLHAAVSHVFNLSYNLLFKRSFLSLGLEHTFTNNAIQQFTSLGTDTIARTTYGNTGRNQNSSASIMMNTTLFKKLIFSFNSIGSYINFSSTVKGGQQINKGFSFSISSTASYRLNNQWRINHDIFYGSSKISAQGTAAGLFKNSVSVNKQFLKNNKASLSISVSNPFQQKRRTFTEINDPLFHQLQESWSVARRFSFSFNYRFGKVQ